MHNEYMDIEKKIAHGERLTYEDGVRLFACHDIAWIGALADRVRQEKCGDIVYYNVNCHVNLTRTASSARSGATRRTRARTR